MHRAPRPARLLPRLVGLLLALGLLPTACHLRPVLLPTPATSVPVTDVALPSPPPRQTGQPIPTVSPVVLLPGFPDPAGAFWQVYATGLEQPVDIQNAGDGSGRLFVVERRGRIRIVEQGRLLPESFLDLTDRILSDGLEQGLLGLAFHPEYAVNGLFFVNYTDRDGHTLIARFRVSDDPQRADLGSQARLLYVEQPFANHNGGGLAFGPDGYLYAGLGDGGSGGDPLGNGQNLDTLLGKLLRLDVYGGDPYAIPPSNPLAGGGGRPEIWATGLRNPWRFSFDAATGDLYIADVGQGAWEEIDHVQTGPQGLLNFGWNYFEGLHPHLGTLPEGPMIQPVAEYAHEDGRCSVTGGYTYRGTALPEWQGVYFCGDYCTGEVFGLIRTAGDAWQTERLFGVGVNISTFGVDEAGELYLADLGSGFVLRLERR